LFSTEIQGLYKLVKFEIPISCGAKISCKETTPESNGLAG